MANRLAAETSPYLRQHKENPVDWHAWGEEALDRAKREDRPILLSIGYSSCHWCHVMAHESFEDPETAAYMNDHFVPIKVDREERPDVDAIYMEAVQAITGGGGWPLTVFLDTDRVPFYGGTYYPPESRGGMPSFRMVMEGVVQAWEERRAEIERAGKGIADRLNATAQLKPSTEILASADLVDAVAALDAQFDPVNGGFGGAPKFPPASAIELLLRRGRRDLAERTLLAMARGGIFDQVGGGFARYSVDARWLVPHFEKMLYDNALLARAYLHGWQVTGNEELRAVCERTLDWALAEMRGTEGGFYAALDADSEGVEGKFYVWTKDGFDAALASFASDEIDALTRYFGVTEAGNFEGRTNVLHVADSQAASAELVERARAALLVARGGRVRPGLDDKRLTAWNALMVSALADAGAVLGRPDYVAAARNCAEFILGELRDEAGRLLRTFRDGEASVKAYLEDYAFLVEALVTLYEATFDPRWMAESRSLANKMIALFADRENGGFFTTATDHEELIARRKDIEDHPTPSGNSAAAFGLLRLAALTGDRGLVEHALGVFRLLHSAASRHPQAFANLLCALDFHFGPPQEIAIVGDEIVPLVAVVRSRYMPRSVIAAAEPGDAEAQRAVPLLAGREPVDGKAAAYVCQNFTCKLPVTSPEELEEQLERAR